MLCVASPTSRCVEPVGSYSLLRSLQKGTRFPFSQRSAMVSSGRSLFFIPWLSGWHSMNAEPLFSTLVWSSPQSTLTRMLHNHPLPAPLPPTKITCVNFSVLGSPKLICLPCAHTHGVSSGRKKNKANHGKKYVYSQIIF